MSDVIFYRHFGRIERYHRRPSFTAKFNNFIPSKSFNIHHYPTEEDAKNAALEYLQMTCDQFGLSIWIFPSDYSKEFKCFFASFIDGDGCINLLKKTYPQISASQSQASGIPEVLMFIQKMYGGKICKKDEETDNHRQGYMWYNSTPSALIAINDVANYGFLKKDTARLIIDYVRNTNSCDCSALYTQLSKMHDITYYLTVPIDASRMTSANVGGLFSAEGCAYIIHNSLPMLQFAQLSSVKYLEAINTYYSGIGRLRKGVLHFAGQHAIRVINDMIPYVVGSKKDQCLLLLQARGLQLRFGKVKTDEQKSMLRKIRDECKRLKKI